MGFGWDAGLPCMVWFSQRLPLVEQDLVRAADGSGPVHVELHAKRKSGYLGTGFSESPFEPIPPNSALRTKVGFRWFEHLICRSESRPEEPGLQRFELALQPLDKPVCAGLSKFRRLQFRSKLQKHSACQASAITRQGPPVPP